MGEWVCASMGQPTNHEHLGGLAQGEGEGAGGHGVKGASVAHLHTHTHPQPLQKFAAVHANGLHWPTAGFIRSLAKDTTPCTTTRGGPYQHQHHDICTHTLQQQCSTQRCVVHGMRDRGEREAASPTVTATVPHHSQPLAPAATAPSVQQKGNTTGSTTMKHTC